MPYGKIFVRSIRTGHNSSTGTVRFVFVFVFVHCRHVLVARLTVKLRGFQKRNGTLVSYAPALIKVPVPVAAPPSVIHPFFSIQLRYYGTERTINLRCLPNSRYHTVRLRLRVLVLRIRLETEPRRAFGVVSHSFVKGWDRVVIILSYENT